MSGTKIPGAMTREMAMLHTAFLREFFLMPRLITGVAAGDRERAQMVAGHIGLIAAGLHEHHSGEDISIWPRLLERCPEEIRPLVHGMEKHHERIAIFLDQLTGAVETWRTDANTTDRDAALRALDGLLPILREHLTEEVEYVLPLIEKYISADEWDGMYAQGLASMPQDAMALVIGIMMYEGDPVAVRGLIDDLPEEQRPEVTAAAPAAWSGYAERLYGTATPPFWFALSNGS